LNNAIPSDSAVFNISLYHQNGSKLVENVETTALGSGSFNYSVTFPAIEVYKVKMFCTDGTYSFSDTGEYNVTYNGEEVSAEKIYIYIVALIFLVLLILGIYSIINRLPSEDARGDDNKIIQMSQLKHLRKVLWITIWTICLGIMYIISNISYAYLSNSLIGSLFFALYQMMFWFTIIGVPVAFILIIWKMYKDAEFQRLLERGVDIGSL